MNRTLKIIKQRKNKRKRKILKNKTLKIGKIKGGFVGPTVITLSEDIFEKPEPKSPKSPKASAAHSDTITIIDEILETELRSIIDVIPEYANNESLIYVSVGSKYTEDTISLMDLEPKPPTNSIYQMIPFFLYNEGSNPAKYIKDADTGNPIYVANKVLNIVIDEFDEYNSNNKNNNGSIEKNLIKINSVHNWVDNTDNINMFIIDLKNVFKKIQGSVNSKIKTHFKTVEEEKANIVQKIIEIITKNVAETRINPQNYMVCNYVKFKDITASTNSHTNRLIIAAIHDALEKYGYTNSEYNWFGYNPVYYNFIYQGRLNFEDLPPFYKVGSYRDNDNQLYTIFEALYKHDNKKLQAEGLTYRFLRENANKMFLIINPEMYDHVYKTQNNFMYSLKEMRDVLFPQTNVPGTVFRR